MGGVLRLSSLQSSTAAALAAMLLIVNFAAAAAQEQGAALTIVADQVRSQGFTCDNPVAAERIEADTPPDQTVYLLKCEGVSYRVQLVPDQAAKISEIE